MSITDQEAKVILDEVRIVAQTCTDTLIRIDQSDQLSGVGSCIYIISPNKKAIWGVTCNHVLKEDEKYFIGAKRLEEPKIPREFHTVPEINIIKRSSEDDLVFFDTTGINLSAAKKGPIDIFQSSTITLDRIKRNLKNAMVISGVPGLFAEFTAVASDSIYSELPLYTAIGPVVEVDETTLIGDFTEKKILFKNTSDFPKLENEQATGGSRDLRGMSGSGGWIRTSEGILVAGILAGPKQATDTIHLIRFVPVWKVISALKQIAQ